MKKRPCWECRRKIILSDSKGLPMPLCKIKTGGFVTCTRFRRLFCKPDFIDFDAKD